MKDEPVDPEPEFDPDECEKSCEEAYYAAEAACKEQVKFLVEERGLTPEQCNDYVETCIGIAESRLDACIHECQQRLFAALRKSQ